jgi:hypothetical protein
MLMEGTLALEIIGTPHLFISELAAASNRETGGIMNKTRHMFAFTPQLVASPWAVILRAVASAGFGPVAPSRQRLLDWRARPPG